MSGATSPRLHTRPPGETPHDGGPFDGFPNTGEATVVPGLFFSRVLPEITDPAELTVTLYVFFAAAPHRDRQPRFVTRRELAADPGLLRSMANLCGGADHEALARGLDLAVERRTLVRAAMNDEEIYVVNTPANRNGLARLAGEGVRIAETLPQATAETAPNIFALYEQNVGNITPLIAEDLKEAEERYPLEWVQMAFREAVELNKRNWRYIQRILERWETEGPAYEKPERDPQIEWLERRYQEGLRRRRPT
jgi:DnaD/phage-associated family protein